MIKFLSRMSPIRGRIFTTALLLSGCSSSAPHEYNPNAPIEYCYSQTGRYDVTRTELAVHGGKARYAVYSPESEQSLRPLVVLQNRTGEPIDTYDAIARHLASWGMAVFGSYDKQMGSGAAAIASLGHVGDWSVTPGHPLYGRIDMKSIGLAGSSQGAAGTINAQTRFLKGADVKAIAIHATPSRRAIDTFRLDIEFDASTITAPVFIITGTEDDFISPVSLSQSIFDSLQGPEMRVLGVSTDADHIEFAEDAGRVRGYLTAWLAYHLLDDPIAAQAFVGTAEIKANPSWSLVRIAP